MARLQADVSLLQRRYRAPKSHVQPPKNKLGVANHLFGHRGRGVDPLNWIFGHRGRGPICPIRCSPATRGGQLCPIRCSPGVDLSCLRKMTSTPATAGMSIPPIGFLATAEGVGSALSDPHPPQEGVEFVQSDFQLVKTRFEIPIRAHGARAGLRTAIGREFGGEKRPRFPGKRVLLYEQILVARGRPSLRLALKNPDRTWGTLY